MIPKSLHTVTALVAVATREAHVMRTAYPEGYWSNAALVDSAAAILGYPIDTANDGPLTDMHGLKAKAVAIMAKRRPYGVRS